MILYHYIKTRKNTIFFNKKTMIPKKYMIIGQNVRPRLDAYEVVYARLGTQVKLYVSMNS